MNVATNAGNLTVDLNGTANGIGSVLEAPSTSAPSPSELRKRCRS